MMPLNKIDWGEIRKPENGLSVKKLKIDSFLPVYAGRDVQGRNLLIIELEGDHTDFLKNKRPSAHGIDIDIRQDGPVQRLIFTLQRQVDKDIFEAFCISLLRTCAEVSDSSLCLAIVLEHVKRWKAFLSGKKIHKLSKEAVRGLFAELHFLEVLISDYELSETDALEAWEGPNGLHQDFIYKDIAVEIKSVSGKERGTIKISSEDQLEGTASQLYLKVYRLIANVDHKLASSLNEKVEKLSASLREGNALDAFNSKLLSYGYVPLAEYDAPQFVITEESTFAVEEGFPRLTRSALPDGVLKVRYEIELHRIERFLTKDKIKFGG